MKFRLIFFLLVFLFLNNCIGTSSKGVFGSGVSIAFDPRTLGTQIDDSIMDKILDKNWLVALSHITGGGLVGNTNRIIDQSQKLDIDWTKWEWPSIFKLIQESGNVPTEDMKKSFNLGIGMVMVVKKNYLKDAETYLQSKNQDYHIIGKVL